MPVNAITAPGERSVMPPINSSVIANATTVVYEVCRITFRIFDFVRNDSALTLIMIQTSSKTSVVPNFCMKSAI